MGLNAESQRSSCGPVDSGSQFQFSVAVNSNHRMMPRILSKRKKSVKNAAVRSSLKQRDESNVINFDDSQGSRTIQLDFEQKEGSDGLMYMMPPESNEQMIKVQSGVVQLVGQDPRNASQRKTQQALKQAGHLHPEDEVASGSQQKFIQHEFSLPSIARRRSSKLKTTRGARFESMGNLAIGKSQN